LVSVLGQLRWCQNLPPGNYLDLSQVEYFPGGAYLLDSMRVVGTCFECKENDLCAGIDEKISLIDANSRNWIAGATKSYELAKRPSTSPTLVIVQGYKMPYERNPPPSLHDQL